MLVVGQRLVLPTQCNMRIGTGDDTRNANHASRSCIHDAPYDGSGQCTLRCPAWRPHVRRSGHVRQITDAIEIVGASRSDAVGRATMDRPPAGCMDARQGVCGNARRRALTRAGGRTPRGRSDAATSQNSAHRASRSSPTPPSSRRIQDTAHGSRFYPRSAAQALRIRNAGERQILRENVKLFERAIQQLQLPA